MKTVILPSFAECLRFASSFTSTNSRYPLGVYCDPDCTLVATDGERIGTVKCHTIPAWAVGKILTLDLIVALLKLKDNSWTACNSLEEIAQVLGIEPQFDNGRFVDYKRITETVPFTHTETEEARLSYDPQYVYNAEKAYHKLVRPRTKSMTNIKWNRNVDSKRLTYKDELVTIVIAGKRDYPI